MLAKWTICNSVDLVSNLSETDSLLDVFSIVPQCNIIRYSWDVEEPKLSCRKNVHRKILSEWYPLYSFLPAPPLSYVTFCYFFVNPLHSLLPSDVIFEWPLSETINKNNIISQKVNISYGVIFSNLHGNKKNNPLRLTC